MKRSIFLTTVVISLTLALAGCEKERSSSQERKDQQTSARQQSQYAKSQPVPVYDWSLERHLVIQLSNIRNIEATTHTVWRSNYGMIEGDCTSVGFAIPYDTSLTNPLQSQVISHANRGVATAVIEQAEPNGLFQSKNSNATWVLCAGVGGTIEPISVESKVTTYSYPVKVDYETNRVTKNGAASVSIKAKK